MKFASVIALFGAASASIPVGNGGCINFNWQKGAFWNFRTIDQAGHSGSQPVKSSLGG